MQKKRPHICVAGWWGTLFLDQFLKKCNPLPVVQGDKLLDATDSALENYVLGETWNYEIIM